jgi:ribosomal-protein-alanine N-acetyltransferase
MASAGGKSAPRGALPLPDLETERLLVRIARPGMEVPIAEFLGANFEGHLDRWSPPVGRAFFSESFWREKLKAGVDEFLADRAVRFVLQLKGVHEVALDAHVVGTVNYTNIVRGPFQACHLGYQIARSHEGLGLMGEALRAANAYMFRQRRLHRIMANYRPENERSGRLLERLGFRREGMAPEYLFIDGAWRDHVLTALTNPDYDPAWIEAPGR